MYVKLDLDEPNYCMQYGKMIGGSRGKEQTGLENDGISAKSQFRSDRVTISSYGISMSRGSALFDKVNNMLANLMKQKENLVERKNDIMANMKEQGLDPKAINDKMKEIDEQIKNLEQAMTKIKLDEQRKKMGLDEESQKEKANAASTATTNNSSSSEEEVAYEKLNTIVAASSDLKQIEFASSIKNKIERSARALKKEIELDESRSLDGKAADSKYREHEKLQERAAILEENIAQKASYLTHKLSENADNENNYVSNTGIVDEHNKDDNNIQVNGQQANLQNNISDSKNTEKTDGDGK